MYETLGLCCGGMQKRGEHSCPPRPRVRGYPPPTHLKLEQSVQVLQLKRAQAEQDAAQAHRYIEVLENTCVQS